MHARVCAYVLVRAPLLACRAYIARVRARASARACVHMRACVRASDRVGEYLSERMPVDRSCPPVLYHARVDARVRVCARARAIARANIDIQAREAFETMQLISQLKEGQGKAGPGGHALQSTARNWGFAGAGDGEACIPPGTSPGDGGAPRHCLPLFPPSIPPSLPPSLLSSLPLSLPLFLPILSPPPSLPTPPLLPPFPPSPGGCVSRLAWRQHVGAGVEGVGPGRARAPR